MIVINQLPTRVKNLLAGANITTDNVLFNTDIKYFSSINGLGNISVKLIEMLIKDNVDMFIDTTKVVAIRKELNNSNRVKKDLDRLKNDFNGRLEFELVHSITDGFLSNDYYDKDIAKYLNTMSLDDIHRHIASLSFVLNSYGSNTPVMYMLEKAKVSLASTIIFTYKKLFGYKDSKQQYRFDKNGTKHFTHMTYKIGDKIEEKEVKDRLKGISFQSGLVLTKRVKTKAGLPSMKLPGKFVKLAKKLAKMEFRIVKDIDLDILFDRVLMDSKEIKSIQNGEFLNKNKTYSDLEKKVLIDEKLEEASNYYKALISDVQLLIEQQDVLGLALHLSVHYDYRGRVYYDLINGILDPQTKVGKFMYEAFTPRILNQIDYETICFCIMSTLGRIAPKNAVKKFEEYPELNIKKLREVSDGDYIAEVYAERLIIGVEDFKSGKPNASFFHKDYTNGGMIHFSIGLTREKKAMKVVNMNDINTVYDPHTIILKSFIKHTGLTNVTRKDIKSAVSQGITAGIAPSSALKKIVTYFKEEHDFDIIITEEQYLQIVEDVYGKTGELLHKFNMIGNSLYDNSHSILPFTSRSGFKSASIAFISGQNVKAYYVSSEDDNRKHLSKVSIYRNMPMHYNITGKNSMEPALVGEHAIAKDKGWLANTTHGANDAVSIHGIAESLVEHNIPALFIHDNIATSGLAHAIVLKRAKEELMLSYNDSPYISALKQASKGRNLVINENEFILEDVNNKFVLGDNFMQA